MKEVKEIIQSVINNHLYVQSVSSTHNFINAISVYVFCLSIDYSFIAFKHIFWNVTICN